MNYTTERWADNQTTEMNFRFEVCDGYVEFQRGKHPLGTAPAFMEALANLRGVQSVRGHGYKLLVEKGRAFEWNEIQPEIDRIIGQFLALGLAEDSK